MGCDIHVYLLKKQKDGTLDELALYCKDGSKAFIAEGRSYLLFSKLAGVRGYEEPISAGYSGMMEGLPSEIVRNYDDYCGHTPVYFPWGELALSAKYEGEIEDEFGRKINIVEEWMNELRIILSAYYIFNTENIYVQIFFDN